MARIEPLGDAALLVTLGDEATIELAHRSQVLARAIRARRRDVPGLGAPVPAFASVLVPFDPLALDGDAARDIVAPLAEDAAATGPPEDDGAPPVEVPTRYGGEAGPDLEAVAALHGLRPAAVIEAHASTLYRVAFLGFLPGWAYLTTLPETIATPRLPTPRTAVPAGSVAIAERFTGIYPIASPGGWRLIGRTDLPVWDPRRAAPALLTPGARVRFVPVAE